MCVTDFQCYGVGLGDTNPRPVGHRHLRTVSYKWIIYSKLFPPELCLSGKIACVTNGETIIGYQLDRPFTKKTRNLLWEETGTLKMPVIR